MIAQLLLTPWVIISIVALLCVLVSWIVKALTIGISIAAGMTLCFLILIFIEHITNPSDL